MQTSSTMIKNPWRPYIMLLVSTFVMLCVLAMNTPAYPNMTAELKFNPAYIAWMMAFYSLTATVLAPIMGRIGDLFGLKKVIIFGLLMYALGCLLAAVAPVYALVVAGRFINGIGVACSMPISMAFAGRFFPPEQQGKAFAIFSMTTAIGPMVGPTLAGIIVESMGWRAIFGIGAAAVFIVTVGVLFLMPSVPVASGGVKPSFDIPGSAVLFVAVGCLLVMPTLATQIGWGSPIVIAMIAVFIVGLVVFWSIEKKSHSPVVRPALLKDKRFLLPVLFQFMTSAIMQSFLYMMSYYIVTGRGFASTMSGLWMSVMYLSMTVFSLVAGQMISRLNHRLIALIVAASYAAAVAVYALSTANTSYAVLLFGGILMGFGASLSSPLSMNTSLEIVPVTEKGTASGAYRLLADVGGAMGVAIFSPLMAVVCAHADGTPDYVQAFPKVSALLGIVVVILIILSILYPVAKKKAH